MGEVSYWMYINQSDSLTYVSTYISQQEQVKFNGTWMLAVEWNNVPEYLGNISIVRVHILHIIILCLIHSISIID